MFLVLPWSSDKNLFLVFILVFIVGLHDFIIIYTMNDCSVVFCRLMVWLSLFDWKGVKEKVKVDVQFQQQYGVQDSSHIQQFQFTHSCVEQSQKKIWSIVHHVMTFHYMMRFNHLKFIWWTVIHLYILYNVQYEENQHLKGSNDTALLAFYVEI